MRKSIKLGLGAALALSVSSAAVFAENVKIAFIDPLSGGFAATGINGLHQFEFAAETLVNAKGGVLGGDMFEILPFDNKVSPKESLIQLRLKHKRKRMLTPRPLPRPKPTPAQRPSL